MSNSVDERIVQMQFDNKQFETNAQQSIKTVEDLKKSLNLEASARSIANLDSVAKKFSLAGMAEGIDAISSRFTTLGIMGITVIQNLTNSAINFGKKVVSALTVDPVKTGLDEYETKINAIQTILTNTESKGTTLDDVNKALAELNTYADQTIYNFSEMTRNIGTFTAAGIDLQTSVESIKGIANLAAGSGSSAQQASTAMYQLSQALAAGSVKLMDWNSVVNAGMGGELFQNALKESAKELGIFVDESVPFRESLKDGWITTDVLTRTLQKFASDKSLVEAATQVKTFTQLWNTMKESVQSGWAVSWENIIGNKDQAAALFTAINNGFSSVSGASATARNNMLAFWNANGGRTALLEGIANALMGIASVLRPVEEAFSEIFPPMTGEKLVELSEKFRDLMSGFKMGEGTAENLKKTFKGLFALLDLGAKAFGFVADCIGLVVKALAPGAGGLLSVTAGVGDFIVSLNDAVEKNKIFSTALEKVSSVISFFKDIVSSVSSAMTGAFHDAGSIITPYITAIEEAIKTSTLLSDAISLVKSGIIKLGNGIKSVFEGISDYISKISVIDLSGISTFTEKITNSFDGLSESGTKVKSSFGWISDSAVKVKDIFIKVGSAVKDFLTPAIEFLGEKLKNITFSDIGSMLAGSGILMIGTTIKKSLGPITDIGESVSNVINSLAGALEAFQTKLKAEAILKIAIAIGVLAASILVLSMINEDALVKAITALTAIFTELSVAMVVLDKASLSSQGISAKLIALGAAILLISVAMQKFANMDQQGLMNGVEGLSAVLTVLALFMKVTSNTTAIQGGVAGLLGIAAGVLVLSIAVEKFASMDYEKMQQGMEGISASLTVLAVFLKVVGSPERMISIGIGIAAIAVAMNLFAGSVALFGLIPIDNLVNGVAAMGASLTLIALAMKLMPKTASIIAIGVGLDIMSVALYAIAGAVALFGSMSIGALVQGITALGVSLAIMAVAANAMNGTLAGSAAILIMAAAILVLAPAIALLGALSLESIGIALLAIAGVFLTLGLTAAILSPLILVILGLAGAIALLGVGVYAIGAGLVAFTIGLAALAAGGTAFVLAFTQMAKAVIDLIPLIAKKLGEGVVAFAVAIQNGMPELMKAVAAIGKGLIQAFTEIIPPLVKALVTGLVEVLETLAEYIQPMVDAGMKLLLGLVRGIADNIEELVKAALDLMTNFLNGLAAKLPDLISAGADVVVAFLKGVGDKLPDLLEAGAQLIIDFINGLADTIRDKSPELIDAFINLSGAILEGLGNGLTSGIKSVGKIAGDIATSIINGFKDILGIHSPSSVFQDLAGYIIDGLVNGLTDNVKKAIDKIEEVGTSIIEGAKDILGIHSPSQMFDEIGKNIIAGLTGGIEDNQKDAVHAAGALSKGVGDAGVDVAKKSNEAAKSAFDKAVEWIDERKYYNKLSLMEELNEWLKLQNQYKAGSEERKKIDREVYRVKNELIQAGYDAQVKVINDAKYYNKLSLQEELADWEEIQRQYAVGTKEREEADKEAYRVREEIRKQEYDSQISRIDDLKYYDQLSLSNELQEWQKVQAQYLEGTEERKKADKEVYRLKKEILAKQKALEDDYYAKVKEVNDKLQSDLQSMSDAYTQKIIDRINSIYSAYGLFDKVEAPEFVSSNDLITNLEDQIKSLTDWSDTLASLTAKGVDEDLLKELQELGPDAADELKALNYMSSEQLNKYVELWRKKGELAHKEALTELKSLGEDMYQEMNTIASQAQTQLDALQNTWETETAELINGADTQLDGLNTVWDTHVTDIKTNTETTFTAMATSISSMDWTSVGLNIVAGIENGITSKAKELADTAAEVALKALKAAKKALGIKSPSKEFAKVGMYADRGIIVGLERFSGKVDQAAAGVGSVAIDGFSRSVSHITDIMDSNMDMTPTIRPVVDLTDVENDMNGLFSQRQGINVSNVKNAVSKIDESISNQDSSRGKGDVSSKDGPISFVQNNYSPKTLSRIEIYRQTKNQIATMKGLVRTT